MLAIGRKKGQSVLIPAFNIRICVHEIRGGNVKLYFDAPEHIRIIRDELLGDEIATKHARPESEGGSDTPQNPPSLPAVNSIAKMDAQTPVRLWDKVQSRKSNKQTGDTTNG